MIAIGIGCRKGCPADDIIALVRATLSCLPSQIAASGLFSHIDKRDEAGLKGAAKSLGLPLAFLGREMLQSVAGGAQTHSPRTEQLFGVPSVAETAALAGAGAGAVLLVPRRTSATATCAIAGPKA